MRDDADIISLATIDAVDVELPVAGAGSRAYAFVVDWHIRIVAALVWFGGVILVQHYLHLSEGGTGLLLGALPAAAIYFLYHPVLETLTGRTPGKRMAGLRIVTREGHAPTVAAHLGRNLFRLLDSLPMFYALGLLVMMFNPRQCRIGDLVAGTLVVFEQAESALGLEVLANASVSPQMALLADELLRRWWELGVAQRRQLALQLLDRAGRPPADDGDNALREALQSLLRGAAP